MIGPDFDPENLTPRKGVLLTASHRAPENTSKVRNADGPDETAAPVHHG